MATWHGSLHGSKFERTAYRRDWQPPLGRLPAPGAHGHHDCICWHDLAIHLHPWSNNQALIGWHLA